MGSGSLGPVSRVPDPFEQHRCERLASEKWMPGNKKLGDESRKEDEFTGYLFDGVSKTVEGTVRMNFWNHSKTRI